MSEHAEARLAIKRATQATKRGDLPEAERWSKTAERLSRAAERLSALPAQAEEEDYEADEAARAELRRRVQAFVDAAVEIQNWEEAKAQHDDACDAARKAGTPVPPPLPPCPGGPNEAVRESYLTSIAKGER